MRLLIVEDNDLIREGLEYHLQSEGFDIVSIKCIEEYSNTMDFDLAILDISLPDGSGFDLCKRVKSNRDIPVIFLTARTGDLDLETGLLLADDYLTKPFRNRELLLRINNLIKRNNLNDIIEFNNIKIDTNKSEVYVDDKNINFTSLEYRLFLLLAKNKNQVLETEYLIDYIYDLTGNYVYDNTIRVYIKRIREKLGVDVIKTIKGVGYKIETI